MAPDGKTMNICQTLLWLIPALMLTGGRMDDPEVRSTALELLRTCSPTGFHIIDTYANAPTSYKLGSTSITIGKSDFTVWIEGTTPREIAQSLNTAVHETCHGYTSLLGYKYLTERGDARYAEDIFLYYTGGNEGILVYGTKTFPSREMANTFSARQKTFRFEAYITPKDSSQGTQVNGVYGLLDELNAYYCGTRVSFDLLPFYEERMPDTPKTWFQYFEQVNGTYYAFLEFKLYIAKYLVYAREKHPDVYEGIMNNDAFRKAFARIDKNWSDLIREYYAAKPKIAEKLRARGYAVSEDDRFIRIGKRELMVGEGNYVDTYNALDAELKNKEMVDILAPLYK
jgi:hypothetical protein